MIVHLIGLYARAPPALSPALGPSIRMYKTTSHPSSLYFLESPANTVGFSACKDYDPHQPSITPGVQTMTMPEGGVGDAGAYLDLPRVTLVSFLNMNDN